MSILTALPVNSLAMEILNQVVSNHGVNMNSLQLAKLFPSFTKKLCLYCFNCFALNKLLLFHLKGVLLVCCEVQ